MATHNAGRVELARHIGLQPRLPLWMRALKWAVILTEALAFLSALIVVNILVNGGLPALIAAVAHHG